MAAGELDAAQSEDELYDADPEALLLRPFMTGDVFTDVSAGGKENLTVAIAGHPCVVRSDGGKLARHVPCCIVGSSAIPIPLEDWPTRQFEKFPLPGSLPAGENLVVKLSDWVMVPRGQLTRDRRIVTLTDRGVYFFLQRFTHSTTRCKFPLIEFHEGYSAVLREAEMEGQWIADISDFEYEETPPTDEQILELTREFQEFLGDGRSSRRQAFREPGGAGRVLSEMNQMIRERREHYGEE